MAYGFTYTLPTISGSHTDFPVLLKTADFPSASIDGTANALANGGGDLIAYTSSAKTTQLPVEVVRFVSGGSPDAEVWVKIGTAATSGTIYIEADSVQTSQPAVTATYGRNAVWSDYESVLHLQESGDGTADEYVDSSGSGNDGTLTVGTSLSVVSTGHPWGGNWLDMTASHVITLTGSASMLDSSAMTISCWRDVDYSSVAYGCVGNRYNSPDNNWFQLQASNKVFVKGATLEDTVDNGAASLATELIHATHNATELNLYIDGSLSGVDSSISNTGGIVGAGDYRLGTYYDDATNRRFDGRLGEVRFRKSVLSSDWMATEDGNQSSSTAWGTVGSWADGGTPTGAIINQLQSGNIGADLFNGTIL